MKITLQAVTSLNKAYYNETEYYRIVPVLLNEASELKLITIFCFTTSAFAQ